MPSSYQSRNELTRYQQNEAKWDKKNSILGISDQYVVLDSFQKLRKSDTTRGELQFNFDSPGNTKDQMIGVSSKITRVIEMQITKFTFPILPADIFRASDIVATNSALTGYLADNDSSYSAPDISKPADQRQQFPFSKRVTMFVREIGQQSFSDNENKRHHIEFDISAHGATTGGSYGDRLLLTPVDDSYMFTDPINHVHGMTINFFNPDHPLRIPPDVIYNLTVYSRFINGSTDNADNCMQFQFIDQTGLITLIKGDRIFIKGFSQTDGVSFVNDYLNRPEGHIIGDDAVAGTNGPTLDSTYTGVGKRWKFCLDPYIKTSLLPGSLEDGDVIESTTGIDMYIAKYRIRIPVRFRTLTNRFTNGITHT
jgi:hypothetical protein